MGWYNNENEILGEPTYTNLNELFAANSNKYEKFVFIRIYYLKNAEKARDPEMHQTKKGNEWKFGVKCHIGVDAGYLGAEKRPEIANND